MAGYSDGTITPTAVRRIRSGAPKIRAAYYAAVRAYLAGKLAMRGESRGRRMLYSERHIGAVLEARDWHRAAVAQLRALDSLTVVKNCHLSPRAAARHAARHPQ